jgi:cation-transporting ATPase E
MVIDNKEKEEILEEETNNESGESSLSKKKKKKSGPQTIYAKDLLESSGDPLFLDIKITENDLFTSHKETKNKNEVLVNRYNPDLDKGLTINDCEQRKLAGLSNIAKTGSSKSAKSIIFSNIFTFFNLLVFGIAGWLISIKSYQDLIFFVIALINISLGIIQEFRAKATIDKLSLLSAPSAFVIREQDEQEIGIEDVVIDDIISLSPGKQIPADAILRKGTLEVNESLLTGESEPIIKNPSDTLYSGSFIVSGNGLAQVTSVGKDIYIQKLTNQAKKYKKPKSDLFFALNTIIRIVGVIILPLAGWLFYINYANGVPYENIVKTVSAAMIGMIPSGLFLLATISLGVGVVRLGSNSTLVQELFCIEMLARIDVLCLDKTGTITDGSMSVKGTIEYKNPTDLSIKNIVSMMLNSLNDKNMTSEALKERFGTAKKVRHKEIIPFSSSRKLSAVSYDKYGTFILGAPEFILGDNYQLIEEDVNKQAREGLRVLSICYSPLFIEKGKLPTNIEPLGLIVIEDNIREDAVSIINYFKESGVEVKVISGDNPLTVSKIASRVGVEGADKYISLDGMGEKEVVRSASRYNVFGRVTPSQKKVLVETLKNNGHTVAMTGDGVNDILALKAADTSIAMASGSEAARNVSHLVLLDSNFSSMPKVVAEGRRVINNIQKVSALFLTKTIFSFLLLCLAIIRQGVYPITPRQLNIIDWCVTGIAAFALALEANNNKINGSFLFNIIKGALPGALVVLINSLIILAFANVLGMTDSVISTLVVLSAAFTTYAVLVRVSRPFNKFRKIVCVVMFIMLMFCVFIIPHFFLFNPFINIWGLKATGWDNTPLSIGQSLLIISIIEATFPMLYIVTNIIPWIKGAFKWFVKLIASVQ